MAVEISSQKTRFLYLKPRPSVEVTKNEIKSYQIKHAEEIPNRRVIIELKDGRKLKSTYSSPEYDFDKLIKELDKSIREHSFAYE